MACAATYCMLYVYERITWTSKAKHEAFRRQYMSCAMSQLGMVAGIVAEHCSSQVKRYMRDLRQQQLVAVAVSVRCFRPCQLFAFCSFNYVNKPATSRGPWNQSGA